jgi:hypothetical protein
MRMFAPELAQATAFGVRKNLPQNTIGDKHRVTAFALKSWHDSPCRFFQEAIFENADCLRANAWKVNQVQEDRLGLQFHGGADAGANGLEHFPVWINDDAGKLPRLQCVADLDGVVAQDNDHVIT